MRSSVNDAHERLLSSRRETQDRTADLKGAQRDIERLTRDCQEANNISRVLEQQMSIMQEEITSLKATKMRLEREVLELQSDVVLEKSNVKNEIQRAQMEREGSKERITKLQVQLEEALQDSSQIEDFKAENIDLKRRLALLQNQMRAAEELKQERENHLREACQKEKKDLVDRFEPEIEDLRAKLRNVAEEKTSAVARAQQTTNEIQVRALISSLITNSCALNWSFLKNSQFGICLPG